jgi:hypothetical protein
MVAGARAMRRVRGVEKSMVGWLVGWLVVVVGFCRSNRRG